MEIFDLLNKSMDRGEPAALCTIVKTEGAVPRHAGAKMIVFGNGQTKGTVGGGETEKLARDAALESLIDGNTRLLNYDLINVEKGDPGVCGGSVTIFVEPYLRRPTVVVVGAGHVGKSVVHFASWLGFRVVLSDDRTELCSEESVPGADHYLPCPMSDIPEHLDINFQTYFVLVTRGVEVDVEGLPALMDTDAPYIGLIGSKRRWQHTQEKLLENGISKEMISRIKSPIGLDINAETPDEIAISIMAEIIALRNDRKQQDRK
jgi:xanthine dehydrogenase accessory factor